MATSTVTKINTKAETKTKNASRATTFRRKQEDKGFAQVSGWVPAEHVAAVTLLMQRLREDRALEPGTLRNVENGRLVKLDRR